MELKKSIDYPYERPTIIQNAWVFGSSWKRLVFTQFWIHFANGGKFPACLQSEIPITQRTLKNKISPH